jgi:glycosyltransferase involved in cell wall biosynthesis
MVKKYNIDVVHSHLFGTSLYSSLASFLSRVPVICTFHGFIDIPEDRWLTHLKLNLIGMLATKIVTVSCSLQDYMTSMTAMWKKKYVTIYNGVDLNHKSKLSRVDARKNLGFPDDIIIVGAVGNIKKAKRYDILIRTAQKVVSEIPNCMFLIAGNHSNPVYKELVELQKDLSVESAVHFLGYQEDVSGFLKALDVFVLSSDSEGFSLAIIEAMIGLIPVVASKCGGPQEIVTHNVDGLLIEIGDDKGLAEGVLSVLNSRVLRETLIDNAAKTVHERFSVKTMLNSYEAVYENLVYQIK